MHPFESSTELYSFEKFNLSLIHLNYNNSGFLTVNFTTNAFVGRRARARRSVRPTAAGRYTAQCGHWPVGSAVRRGAVGRTRTESAAGRQTDSSQTETEIQQIHKNNSSTRPVTGEVRVLNDLNIKITRFTISK